MSNPDVILRSLANQGHFICPAWICQAIELPERFMRDNLNMPCGFTSTDIIGNIIFIKPINKILQEPITGGAEANLQIWGILIEPIGMQGNPTISIYNTPHEMAFKLFWNPPWPTYRKTFPFVKAKIPKNISDCLRGKIGSQVLASIFDSNIIGASQGVHEFNGIRIFTTKFNGIFEKATIRPKDSQKPRKFGAPFLEKINILFGESTPWYDFAFFSFSANNGRGAHGLSIGNSRSCHIYILIYLHFKSKFIHDAKYRANVRLRPRHAQLADGDLL
jgi:hypothetical protein